MNGSADVLEISDDHLNISDHQSSIIECELNDTANTEEIDLKPYENYSMISLDPNPDGSLMHPSSADFTDRLTRPLSTGQHNNNHEQATTNVSSVSDRSQVVQPDYQQVSESSSEVKSTDPSRVPVALEEDEMDCQIMESSNDQQPKQSMDSRNDKQPEAKKPARAEPISSETKTRTITLKLPPINGGEKPNLVLKFDKNSQAVAATEKPISSSSPLKSPTKAGTTRPIIQTINPTPKLIIKPLTPPADLATNSSSPAAAASQPLTSTSASKTNESTSEKLKTKCLREGCHNLAIKNEDWEEFCSAECLIVYCKICFKNWVAHRQKEGDSS